MRTEDTEDTPRPLRTHPRTSPRVALGICPRVALGSAPLKGHESIFKTFSKGPFRPSRGTEAHLVLLLKTSLAL